MYEEYSYLQMGLFEWGLFVAIRSYLRQNVCFHFFFSLFLYFVRSNIKRSNTPHEICSYFARIKYCSEISGTGAVRQAISRSI